VLLFLHDLAIDEGHDAERAAPWRQFAEFPFRGRAAGESKFLP